MSIKVNFISNSARFLNKFNRNKATAINNMGKYIVPVIISDAPKDTGLLKKSIKYEAKNNSLVMIADTFYATFVELGTYRMDADPFMKRAIMKSISAFTSIIVRSFKV